MEDAAALLRREVEQLLGEVDAVGRAAELVGERRDRTHRRRACSSTNVTKFDRPIPKSHAVRATACRGRCGERGALAGELRAPVGGATGRSDRTRRTAASRCRRTRSRSRRGSGGRARRSPRSPAVAVPSPLIARASSSWVSAPSTSVHAAQLMIVSGACAPIAARTAAASVMSSSPRASADDSRALAPRRRATHLAAEHPAGAGDEDHGTRTSELSPSMKRYARGWLRVATDPRVAPEQRGLDATGEVADLAAGEEDRVLDLGGLDHAPLADGGVGADVGVAEARARADDRRTAHGRALEARARLDDDAAVELRIDELARRSARRACRGSGGWPRACRRAGRCPSTSRARRATRRAARSRSGAGSRR